jgi:DNA-binding CsgD family transcriptional regulator
MNSKDRGQLSEGDVSLTSPAGFHIALRIGFAFPAVTVSTLPLAWVSHYTENNYFVLDPVIKWAFKSNGYARWTSLSHLDNHGVFATAASFGLKYGVAVGVFDDNAQGHRSYAIFCRADREFTDIEMQGLHAYVLRRHKELSPPTSITDREIETLTLVSRGYDLKSIASDLGVTESAIKLRLKCIKVKLGAKTTSEAISKATVFGLI